MNRRLLLTITRRKLGTSRFLLALSGTSPEAIKVVDKNLLPLRIGLFYL
jgi:hypothetical protein